MERCKSLGCLLLRWIALLGGAGICGLALTQQGPSLRWPETLLLAAIRFALLFRTVVIRRDSAGDPVVYHTQGEALTLIALLRGGPTEALAVSLISGAFCQAWSWREGPGSGLCKASQLFYFPALTWIGGCVYLLFGGQTIITPGDSARFYYQPVAILLPYALMLVLVNDGIHRAYMAAIRLMRDGTPLRDTWLDPMFSCFVYLEALSAALLLVQWTTWGWGSVPFAILTNESLLLAGRAYFERLEAWREADSDAMTGLASWRGIEIYLHRLVRRACVEPVIFALLFLDADGLKSVNDRFGHAAGDELIALIGECCRMHARETDLVGRRGGDEFLLVLDGLDREEAEKVRARLQRAIADTLAVHPLFADVAGASIGLSVFPHDASEPDELIRLADSRMYMDKQERKAVRV